MKLISWNVNGLRACIQKGFLDFFQKADADFFCLQETKLSEGQINLSLPGYHQFWCYAEKKGYSGTAIFTKHEPLSVSYGIGVSELDKEGRVITLEYPEFYLVNCYTPNAQRGLARIEHRMKWDEAYRSYISGLDAKKPTILCGDLNVAHQEIDLKNPNSNRGNAGFSDAERDSFSKTLSLGFTDSFRYLHPDTIGAYTWWSYMYHARENNAGWRIDYFLVSDRIRDKVYHTPIYSDVLGSDHCPVGLELDLTCNGSIWHEEGQGQAEFAVTPNKAKSIAMKVVISTLAVMVILGVSNLFTGLQSEWKSRETAKSHAQSLITETLVYQIVSDDTIQSLLETAVSGTDYQKAVSQNYYLAELETRYDANEYLLKWFNNGTEAEQWTAYVLLSQELYRSRLSDSRLQTYLRMAEGITSFEKDTVVTLSTEELLQYVLSLDYLCSTIAGYYPYVEYQQLMNEFPAFEELSLRDDFISAMMQAENVGSLRGEVIEELLYHYIDKMDAEEEAMYLLRQYPSCIYQDDLVTFENPPESSSTEELIQMLLLDSGLGVLLLRASDDPVREVIFSRTSENVPMVSEMIHREDFIDTMFSLSEKKGLNTNRFLLRAVMRLSIVQRQMSPEQMKRYEDRYQDLLIYHGNGTIIEYSLR